MNFIDKITGNDMKRQLKSMEERVNLLPLDYQEVWRELQGSSWLNSDFTGRNLMPFFEQTVDLMELSAFDGLSVDEVFGDDIQHYIEDLSSSNGILSIRDKYRKQLRDNVARKLKGEYNEY